MTTHSSGTATISTDKAAREEILARIRRASTDVTEKDPVADVAVDWTYGSGLPIEDVVGEFVEKVLDYDAAVVRVSRAGVPKAVVDGLMSTGATSSVVVPAGLDESWTAAIREHGLEIRTDSAELSNQVLNETDAVVTAAASAIADTGTIVLTHGPDQGRRAISLVPDRHVCVVLASQVVSDVPQSIAAVKPAVVQGSPVTMISGGSATSDIELARVEGVHGPRQLYVVVVDDA